MTHTILFDPLLPWPVIWGLATLVLASLVLALWRRLPGWGLRGLAALCLLGALTGPLRQSEDRAPLSDIVLVAVDNTASQQLSDRQAQMARAQASLDRQLKARPNTETRWITLEDGTGDSGTTLLQALSQALADEPQGRVAGIIALSDGQIHDTDHRLNCPRQCTC